jgi:hypothetical protein
VDSEGKIVEFWTAEEVARRLNRWNELRGEQDRARKEGRLDDAGDLQPEIDAAFKDYREASADPNAILPPSE